MMRFAPTVGVGLGLFVALPAFGVVQDGNALQSALNDTVRALAVLTGIESQAAQGRTVEFVPLAIASSEAPIGDARSRDEMMERLRKDVGRLQLAYDERTSAPGRPSVDAAPGSGQDGANSEANSGAPVTLQPGSITTGIPDDLRAQFSSEPLLTSVADTGVAMGTGAPTKTGAPQRIADELRRGQALYRSGKYKEALIALRAIENDVRAKYWLARSLEKLERFDEALQLYQTVAADPAAGYLAERARNDAEFLAWRQTFRAKIAKEERATPTPKPAAKDASGKPADASSPSAKPQTNKGTP